LNKSGLTDNRLQQQTAKAHKKWTEILERVNATIKTLAQQNLSLRGHRVSLVGDSNPGKFLAFLSYLEKSDRALALSFCKTWLFVILFSRHLKLID
jgi:tRNA U34 5-carboxymethylaminomethyl modifying GTPase MnmE/TrmE